MLGGNVGWKGLVERQSASQVVKRVVSGVEVRIQCRILDVLISHRFWKTMS